jgi:hypothetical protein
MVVLATETYGAKGTEIMGTYEELQYAMRHELPMFIVKMCPKLKESRAAILLEPRQVEQNRWSAGEQVPAAVIEAIVDAVNKIKQ